jgi:hypothetical protein
MENGSPPALFARVSPHERPAEEPAFLLFTRSIFLIPIDLWTDLYFSSLSGGHKRARAAWRSRARISRVAQREVIRQCNRVAKPSPQVHVD